MRAFIFSAFVFLQSTALGLAQTELKIISRGSLDPATLTSIARQVEALLPLSLPASVTIEEVWLNKHIASAYYDERIEMVKHAKAIPVLAHEYAHVIIFHNLSKNIPEFNAYQTKQKRYYYLRSRMSNEAEREEMINLNRELTVVYDLRLLSHYFEEILGDLIAVSVLNDPAAMDLELGQEGLRNYDNVEIMAPKLYWDPHGVLVPLGKHVYGKYLRLGTYPHPQVFKAFYELLEEEVRAYVAQVIHLKKNPQQNTPLPVTRDGRGEILMMEKPLKQYIEEMKSRFDAKMESRD